MGFRLAIAMIRPHVTDRETLIEASHTSDVDLAYLAFLNDIPRTTDAAEARELFSRLVASESTSRTGT